MKLIDYISIYRKYRKYCNKDESYNIIDHNNFICDIYGNPIIYKDYKKYLYNEFKQINVIYLKEQKFVQVDIKNDEVEFLLGYNNMPYNIIEFDY